MPSPLVSPDWLAEHLGSPSLRVLDASWYLPAANRDARSEYAEAHVPGALFFDVDAASDPDTDLPHMLPRAEAFARYVGALGVGDGSDVVIYDGSGVNLSAPRAWWMFRVFGHERVSVLDGGLRRWRAEGRPLEQGEVQPSPATFTARLDATRVRDLAHMRDIVRSGAEQVVDMRPAGRFAGTAPEPRAGLRSGHMPGSVSLPFTELVQPDGSALPLDALREKLRAAGVQLDRPIVATCGSGTSACSLLLNLERLDVHAHALYDGAWTEWAGRADSPVEG